MACGIINFALGDAPLRVFMDVDTSLFGQLERMGKDAAIPQLHMALMLLASIDPNCFLESSAAALRTKEMAELTREYVATTLIDEHNAKHSSGVLGSNLSREKCRRRNRRRKNNNNSSGSKVNCVHSGDFVVENTARALAADMDGHSRYLFVAFLVTWDTLYDAFDAECKMFRKIRGVSVESLHSDVAKEYVRLQKNICGDRANVSSSAP